MEQNYFIYKTVLKIHAAQFIFTFSIQIIAILAPIYGRVFRAYT